MIILTVGPGVVVVGVEHHARRRAEIIQRMGAIFCARSKIEEVHQLPEGGPLTQWIVAVGEGSFRSVSREVAAGLLRIPDEVEA